jgi:hypothetical protein
MVDCGGEAGTICNSLGTGRDSSSKVVRTCWSLCAPSLLPRLGHLPLYRYSVPWSTTSSHCPRTLCHEGW